MHEDLFCQDPVLHEDLFCQDPVLRETLFCQAPVLHAVPFCQALVLHEILSCQDLVLHAAPFCHGPAWHAVSVWHAAPADYEVPVCHAGAAQRKLHRQTGPLPEQQQSSSCTDSFSLSVLSNIFLVKTRLNKLLLVNNAIFPVKLT